MSDDDEDAEAEIPNRGFADGQPIPDLSRIPRDRWQEVLRPLSPRALSLVPPRNTAVGDNDAVLIACGEASLAGPPRRVPLPQSAALPVRTPVHAPAAKRRGTPRQVNLRLAPDLYEDLCEVAADHGLKPTQLARMLVTNGVRRYAYEQRRLSGR